MMNEFVPIKVTLEVDFWGMLGSTLTQPSWVDLKGVALLLVTCRPYTSLKCL